MAKYYHAVLEMVADRTAEELVGALLVALVVSLIMTGLYGLVRRKVSDPLVLMCSLMIVASVVSMTTSAGYLQRAAQRNVRPGGYPNAAYPPGYGRNGQLVRKIFESADTDGDGKLSEREASKAAARFIRSLDPEGKIGVDEDALRMAVRERLGPPPAEFGPRFAPPHTAAAVPRPR